ncbi:MAG: bifunctional phosphoglucose/phosphomannose isomerase [Candidatus Saccharimonadales bacterium]
MLDDLKFIHARDGQDALGIAEKQWQQLDKQYQLSVQPRKFANIVFAGMGGSALAALVSKAWPGYDLPFEICRNYDIPKYVSDQTLFFASSYSGNTEETISALEQAEQAGATIVVIASGGKLTESAKVKGHTILEPGGMQPRYASLYGLKAIITALDAYGVTTGKTAELAQYSGFLKDAAAQWRPDVATANNQAKQIALELMGKSVVIYAGPKLASAAYKWKISMNENAKHLAWWGELPEFNHNEMLGWTEQPVQKPYAVIEFKSGLEHPRVQKRFEVTNQVLSGKRPAPIVIEPKGESLLEQLIYTIALGDFVSIYLALLNNINPTPVDLIEKFKKLLDQ